jgi:phospho-N-acetylmuramoyl-pentapeptide-transferase
MPLLPNELILVFWVAFGGTALLSYPIYRLLLLTKSRQTIDPHAPETHQRKQGTPTMGGLMFLLALIPVWLFDPYRGFDMGQAGWDGVAIFYPFRNALCVLFVLFAAIGFVDDFVVPKVTKKRGLGWMPKLVAQIAFAAIAAGIAYGTGDWVKIGGAVFFILFWSNAFNFADGLDGLSGSVLLGLTVGFIGLATLRSDGQAIAGLMVALIASALVFLAYNAPPAKVFMGDVGSLPVGATLGLCAFQLANPYEVASASINEAGLMLPLLILGFVMIAELVPVPMQVGYFKLTKGKRLFPFTPIHHAFEKKGWPESRVVWSFALVQLLLSVAAITVALRT